MRVVFTANSIGLGGTEKGMVLQAIALRDEGLDVRVAGVLEGGERVATLEAAGVPVTICDGDEERLVGALLGADVVIAARRGTPEPLLPAAARRAAVGHVVEWNIFGGVDDSPDRELFACRLFISRMICERYRALTDASWPAFGARHLVHPLPVDPSLRRRAPVPRDARLALGLDPDRPVVARVGRADDLKWRNLVIDMLPGLLRRVPEVQIVLVGATPAKERRLRRRGILDRCLLLEPTADEDRLAAIFAASDVLVGAAMIGESQGLASLEAMSLGVPVVTCSTPWADNAQVEVIEHGVDGLIADHPAPFAEAVALLLRDPARRDEMGRAAASAAAGYAPAVLAGRLVALCRSLVDEGTPPDEWTPSRIDVEAFARAYPRRAATQLRRLTLRERVEVQAARRLERAGQVARGVRAALH